MRLLENFVAYCFQMNFFLIKIGLLDNFFYHILFSLQLAKNFVKCFYETRIQNPLGKFEQLADKINLKLDFWIIDLPQTYRLIWLKNFFNFVIPLTYNMLR